MDILDGECMPSKHPKYHFASTTLDKISLESRFKRTFTRSNQVLSFRKALFGVNEV